jgi:hypothetical protein
MRERRLPDPLDATEADPDPGAVEEPLENMEERRRLAGRFFSTVDMAAESQAEGDGCNIVRRTCGRVSRLFVD